MEILIYLIFFGIPIAVTIWFITALIIFLRTPKEDLEKRRKRKILFIIPMIIAIVLWLAVLGIIIMLISAIAHM